MGNSMKIFNQSVPCGLHELNVFEIPVFFKILADFQDLQNNKYQTKYY